MNKKNLEKAVSGFIENIILKSTPENPLWNSENRIFSKENKWNYIDACMIKAVTGLYEVNRDKRLYDFAKKYTDSFISDENTINSMNPKAYNLDNINGGKNLLYFYKKTNDEHYLNVCDWLYESQLESHPRLKCGNFWHKLIYPNQIWLDGVYMVMPFLAEYAIIKHKDSITEDILMQLKQIEKVMCSNETGLYYHGYDESRKMYWADKKSGLSHEYWLRSICWLAAGLVDIFEITGNTQLRLFLENMIQNLFKSMINYQNENGMFFQLPAKKDVKGNYYETSGTALYAYSALKAERLHICGNDVKQSGLKALEGILNNYIEWDNGVPVLKNICLVAGLGGNENRDGSEKYYLNEIIAQNDAKGIAPFIMAYTEYLLGDSVPIPLQAF